MADIHSVRKLDTTIKVLPKGRVVFRVHSNQYGADTFNASSTADARFSPLFDEANRLIPTLYAGTTLDCALMETVFHDVPFAPGLKTLPRADFIDGRVFSRLQVTRDLHLIDLRSIALRKLGIVRTELIDTHKSQYPLTRQWAHILHLQNPDAMGMLWTSRQDDTGSSLILFGDRLDIHVLAPVETTNSLVMPDGSIRIEILDLANRLGVLIV